MRGVVSVKKKFVTFALASAMAVGCMGIMTSAADKDLHTLESVSGVAVSDEELSLMKDELLEEPMAINDQEDDPVVNIEDLTGEIVDPDKIANAPISSLARATDRINWDIGSGRIVKASEPYSLEAGETVIINCSYSPANASVDFGLITPDGNFRHATRTGGSINKEIKIYSRGQYRLAIRNNSNKTVSVSGFVNY